MVKKAFETIKLPGYCLMPHYKKAISGNVGVAIYVEDCLTWVHTGLQTITWMKHLKLLQV